MKSANEAETGEHERCEIEQVVAMLDSGTITAEMFMLAGHDGTGGEPEFIARLTVDSDVALAALVSGTGLRSAR